MFSSNTVQDHWTSPSRNSLGDDMIITSLHWGALPSHGKPLAKQRIIYLISALLLHKHGWPLLSGPPGHARSGSSAAPPLENPPHGSGGAVNHGALSPSQRDGQVFKPGNQHSHSHCHRD